MPTPLEARLDSVFGQIEVYGYDRETDAPLFEYAERWVTSNQFMDVSDKALFDMFITSYGVTTYDKFGFVPEDDD
ncbi:hypothetical protein SEA_PAULODIABOLI_238 [Microbacterium phage PauloDiaboli]|nr:hypothetical protein SEA_PAULODIABOLI_238 [Microbacterium phage PauloDiaboli]